MNETIYLIIFLTLMFVTWKYIKKVWPNKTLVTVLGLLLIPGIGYILKNILHLPILLAIGMISGLILAPLILVIHIGLQNSPSHKSFWGKLMLVPLIGLIVHSLTSILHFPLYGFFYLMMIVSVLVGGYIIIKKPPIEELLPFHIIYAFIIMETFSLFY